MQCIRHSFPMTFVYEPAPIDQKECSSRLGWGSEKNTSETQWNIDLNHPNEKCFNKSAFFVWSHLVHPCLTEGLQFKVQNSRNANLQENYWKTPAKSRWIFRKMSLKCFCQVRRSTGSRVRRFTGGSVLRNVKVMKFKDSLPSWRHRNVSKRWN